jgi:hypothetical protein
MAIEQYADSRVERVRLEARVHAGSFEVIAPPASLSPNSLHAITRASTVACPRNGRSGDLERRQEELETVRRRTARTGILTPVSID